MNLTLRSLIAAATLTAALAGNAQSVSTADTPMTRAVLQVYDKMIEADPTDYESLLARGQEYYNQDDYVKALADLNQALRYAPDEDKELRFTALSLRAAVLERSNKPEEALADLNAALAIDPESYTNLYQRANVLYALGRYTEAREDYMKLLRRFPRSQEAMFGLARVAVKENNLGLANDYADNAVELASATAESYIRRASVRTLMGNAEGAVDDYIVALSTDDSGNGRALQALVNLARTNYPAVMNGLSRAIRQAPRVGMFYYIRAAIAEAHFNYTAAIADYDKILNDGLYSYAGLNSSLAKCFYALGQYDTALANADYAISATTDNAPYYALKSEILSAQGDYSEALANADRALTKDPDSNDALRAKAMAQIGLGQAEEASVSLAEALINAPDSPSLLMTRAWVCGTLLSQPKVADALFARVIDNASNPDDVNTLMGFALYLTGNTETADQWMEALLQQQPDYDGAIHYYGACYYSMSGDTERALDCAARAMDNGYADYHNWMELTTGYINVAPLRSNPRFLELIDRHSAIFNR